MATLVEKLTAIADAIREVEGTDDTYTLDEMAEHVGVLFGGDGTFFGGTDTGLSSAWSTDSTDDNYYQNAYWYGGWVTQLRSTTATSIGAYAFYNYGDDGPALVDLSAATSIGSYAFYNDWALKTLNLPVCTTINNYAFYTCEPLTSLELPACTSIKASAFRRSSLLESVDLPVCTSIGNYAFYDIDELISLTLGADEVCTLSNKNALAYTPIENGDGYIYVPADLVEEYQSATNWSTYADQIKAIEE